MNFDESFIGKDNHYVVVRETTNEAEVHLIEKVTTNPLTVEHSTDIARFGPGQSWNGIGFETLELGRPIFIHADDVSEDAKG